MSKMILVCPHYPKRSDTQAKKEGIMDDCKERQTKDELRAFLEPRYFQFFERNNMCPAVAVARNGRLYWVRPEHGGTFIVKPYRDHRHMDLSGSY